MVRRSRRRPSTARKGGSLPQHEDATMRTRPGPGRPARIVVFTGGSMKSRSIMACARIAGALVLATASLMGCSENAKMVHSQTTPEFKPGTVKKVFIVGVADDKHLR